MKKICGSSPRTLHQPLAALGSRLGFSTTCCTPGYPPRMIVPFDHQPVILGVLEINLESNAEVVPEVGLQDIYSIFIYIIRIFDVGHGSSHVHLEKMNYPLVI